MTARPLSLAIAILLVPMASLAALPATELDQVIVTAHRTAVPLAESIAPTQVIEREEIERSQARSLPELLHGRAGVQVTSNGGPGALTSVFMRGSESDHVLVLVDGVRIGSVTAGLAALQDLPTEQIERIEIVRGPLSALYGPDAIGGVIQVFTRRTAGALRPHARVGVGSHRLREASAGLGGEVGRGWFGVDAAFQRTDGINACRGSATLSTGCFVDEPDRDGYRNRSLNLRGGLALSDSLTLDASALRAEAFNAFDGSLYGGNEADNVSQVVGLTLTLQASDTVRLTARAGRSDDKSRTYFRDHASGARADVGRIDSRRDSASLQADVALTPAQQLGVGVDLLDDRVSATTAYAQTQRRNNAAFVQYHARMGAHRLQGSLRVDDNQQFGGHVTGSLGWGLDLSDTLRLDASVGTGFKAPTFNDLYFPGSESPDLAPERSRTANLGLHRHAAWGGWSINLFQSQVRDLIVFVYPPPDYIGQGMNIDRARIRGGELAFNRRIDDWSFVGALSHVEPRDHSHGDHHGHLLPRRARTTARLDVDRSLGALQLGVTGQFASGRYDNPANTVQVAGSGTLDLRAAWAVHPDWTVEARATNVFDNRYETVAWYYQPGREYGLALRYHPGR